MAVAAIMGNAAGLSCIGDQRAFRRSHLGKAAIGGAEAAGAEGIVPAGVEDDYVEPRARALHLPHHQVDVDHLEIDIGLARRIGVDWHKVVGAAHLDAVASVIEQCDVGALDLPSEVLHGVVQRRLVQIELGMFADQAEAEALKRFGHQHRIVAGIVEAGDVLIGGIAHHKRDAFLRNRGTGR